MENYLKRDEAEKIIREAITDYLALYQLEDILDIIYGSGEFLLSEDNNDDEENSDF